MTFARDTFPLGLGLFTAGYLLLGIIGELL